LRDIGVNWIKQKAVTISETDEGKGAVCKNTKEKNRKEKNRKA
jgi:hypothetical protein